MVYLFIINLINTKMRKIILTFALLLTCTIALNAQFTKASFQLEGHKLPYQIMYPEGYDSSKRYPLVVFLHGAGERGDDNERQLTHGKQFLIDNFRSKYPAIVIAPQCPSNSWWTNARRNDMDGKLTFTFGYTDTESESMHVLTHLVGFWLSSGSVDLSRVYVGGLSMGGMGTFELLWRMPYVFAAAFPICGGSSIDKMPLYAKNTALWVFHGSADSVVPVDFSRKAVKELQSLGCEVKYTEYEGVDHNSWDNAFNEKDLPKWIFQHKH